MQGYSCPTCNGEARAVRTGGTLVLVCDACNLPPSEVTLLSDPMAALLREAESLVAGPRRQSYGTPHDNHGRTAALWGAYLGRPLTAHDVCMLNILQKISRLQHSVSRDNLVDIAGYSANAEEIRATTNPGTGP